MSALPNSQIRLPHGVFALLRDLVRERTGLEFADEKMVMFLEKLSPVVMDLGMDSFLDYYYLLKYEPAAGMEWRTLFDAITTRESFFWREVDHIRLLVDVIVPQYFAAFPNETLIIWSAACASGEEPLTIAMALNEAGWFERAGIEIFASDASPQAIEAAQKGNYRERCFRRLPRKLRQKYFVEADGLSRVSSELHSRIHWGVTNLMSIDDVADVPPQLSVIFCRNLFIYFSQSAVRKTLRVFAGKMTGAGYLFVGAAESLLSLTSDFAAVEMGDTFVYSRNGSR